MRELSDAGAPLGALGAPGKRCPAIPKITVFEMFFIGEMSIIPRTKGMDLGKPSGFSGDDSDNHWDGARDMTLCGEILKPFCDHTPYIQP